MIGYNFGIEWPDSVLILMYSGQTGVRVDWLLEYRCYSSMDKCLSRHKVEVDR